MIPFEVVHESTPPEPPPSTAVSVVEVNAVGQCSPSMIVAPAVGALVSIIAWQYPSLRNEWRWIFASAIFLSWLSTAAVSYQVWRNWFSEEGILSGRAILLLALVVGLVANIITLSSSTVLWLSAPLSSAIVWTFFVHLSLYFSDRLHNLAIASSSLLPPRSLERRGDKAELAPGQVLSYDAVVTEGVCEVLENRFGFVSNYAVKRHGDEISGGSRVTVGSARVSVSGVGDEQEIAPYIEAFESTLREPPNAPHTRRLQRSLVVMFILFSGALLGVWLSEIGVAATLERVALIFTLGFLLEAESLNRALRRSFFATMFRKGALFRAPGEALKFLSRTKKALLHPPPSALATKIKDVRIVDDRVDHNSLYSSIYCVLCGAKSTALKDLGLFARSKLKTPTLLAVEGIEESDSGITARVEGAPFVVGDEEFLIDNGVHLDLSPDSPPQIFVSIGGAIVATCDLSPPFEDDGKSFVESLRSLGITTHLIGSDAQGTLDDLGRRAGVELARVHGALDSAGFKSIVMTHKDSLLIGHKETPKEAYSVSEFSASLFDPLAYRFDRDNLTLFGDELKSAVNALIGVRSYTAEMTFLILIASLIAIYTLSSSLFGLAPAGAALFLWAAVFTWIGLRPVYGVLSSNK